MTRAARYATIRAIRRLRQKPLSAILAIGSLAAALLLASMVYLIARNVETATGSWGGGVQMVVYLEEGTSEVRATRIADALRQLAAIENTELVLASAAIERLTAALGEHDGLLTELEPGMLPMSIEVTLGDGIQDVVAAHSVVERLETIDGVEEVEFIGGWVGKLTSVVGAIQNASWALFTLMCFASVWIAAATLRMTLRTDRAHEQVLELIGASRGFVRGPALIEGLILGAAGAALAAALLWLLFRSQAEGVTLALSHAVGAVSLSFLPATEIALLVIGGSMIGLVGSWLAFNEGTIAS